MKQLKFRLMAQLLPEWARPGAKSPPISAAFLKARRLSRPRFRVDAGRRVQVHVGNSHSTVKMRAGPRNFDGVCTFRSSKQRSTLKTRKPASTKYKPPRSWTRRALLRMSAEMSSPGRRRSYAPAVVYRTRRTRLQRQARETRVPL